MSANLNEFQNATVGMTCGIIEVLMLQPFNYAKNMAQQKLPIQFNPMVMYRGVGSNCVNMGSCTMIQFVMGGKLKQMILKGDDRRLKPWEEMMVGLTAGSVSALAGSPLELVMTQQQRKGKNTVATMQTIATPNNFFRGFVGCAIREALWTCGYLSIPLIARGYLMQTYPTIFDSTDKARVPSCLLGGMFACYLSQPVDTIKTCMQGDIERQTYRGFNHTAGLIWKEDGIRGFYRGATFRFGRMAIAVTILDTLREYVSPLMYPNAYK
mmetsp:Transcript_13286/g.19543  ORF Transcript_13286/g.19543 Transcript_13286/m.19543 type:complete len:268 (+) Transcript_13286:117-920(+)|eukprot:CAMPEP_0194217526 /NCGR_PEP_ID=MMETSP0156-20130528/21491_1 /TAXON_ID=33649 /ORGANISM="Thalassionema nitzschioides, Strain L26-B" /LENGTH=267 /DNA_ID=CAMNT_0038946595 /DNA_START=78 /DNA_END=881 /DNA_ORIENTATION=+